LNRVTVTGLFIIALALNKVWIGGPTVDFGKFFLAGAMMRLWEPPLRSRTAAICAFILAASFFTFGLRMAFATCGAYLVIYAALATRPVRLTHDLSYGIYLYAFPVQQVAASWIVAWGGSAWVAATVSLPIVLCLAAASWQFVERPCLSVKGVFGQVQPG